MLWPSPWRDKLCGLLFGTAAPIGEHELARTTLDERIKLNMEWWNEAAPIHAASRYYDVRGFKSGRLTLNSIERAALGEVSGKSLLHLQCHFGMDTMSWARLGARATGVDFSENAIDIARGLNDETGLGVRFIQSDVYDLPNVLDEKFDIVYSALGVLCWLPDVERWAKVAANHLKPGGTLFLMDGHPVHHMFQSAEDSDSDASDLRVHSGYWHGEDGAMYPGDEPSYASGEVVIVGDTWEWQHTLSSVINAVIGAGLRLTGFHEHPESTYAAISGMTKGDDGWYRLPDGAPEVPMLYSLTATR